jgi:hypothetical protein
MRWRVKQFCCFICNEIVKQAMQQCPCPQPKPKMAGVELPTKLRSPKHASQWEVQHRKWNMNGVIANEMAHGQFMPRKEMKALVTKQNCKNTVAQRNWKHWSEERREQHKFSLFDLNTNSTMHWNHGGLFVLRTRQTRLIGVQQKPHAL